MNVSEKHKAFLWMLPKTGSIHCFHVFKIFGFETLRHPSIDKTFIHNHLVGIPQNSEKYKFICTARNPFTRFLSLYKFNNKNPETWSPDDFKSFFLKNQKFLESFLWPFKNRLPDQFIRLESLWADYNEIDFIKNSEFNLSGELYEFCQKKINQTKSLPNPEKYYTPEMIDFFFSNGKKYFDTLGYSYPF
jgi:hypothetical protein